MLYFLSVRAAFFSSRILLFCLVAPFSFLSFSFDITRSALQCSSFARELCVKLLSSTYSPRRRVFQFFPWTKKTTINLVPRAVFRFFSELIAEERRKTSSPKKSGKPWVRGCYFCLVLKKWNLVCRGSEISSYESLELRHRITICDVTL